MADKLAKRLANLKPPYQKGQRHPGQGKGPKKGALNAGRPREDFLAWCRDVVSDPRVEKAALSILTNPKHPQFTALWSKVAERGYGPEGATVQIDKALINLPVAFRIIKVSDADDDADRAPD